MKYIKKWIIGQRSMIIVLCRFIGVYTQYVHRVRPIKPRWTTTTKIPNQKSHKIEEINARMGWLEEQCASFSFILITKWRWRFIQMNFIISYNITSSFSFIVFTASLINLMPFFCLLCCLSPKCILLFAIVVVICALGVLNAADSFETKTQRNVK